jgi:dTDP-4-amino-4,6-dideoxygalactose transaminase
MMEIPFFDLKRQYGEIKAEIEAAVTECLAGGVYIKGGEVSSFEEEMARYLGVKYAVGVGNGTDALVIALKAADIKDKDEVITTPFSFFATGEAIVNAGGVPVFADVLEGSYNIDPDSVRKKITAKTKALLPVHIFGCPARMDELLKIADEHGLKVIEDACQAVGALYRGKKAGSIGDLGCFSFFPTKNLGGVGDGGLIATNDSGLATICLALREHGGGKIGASAKEILAGRPAIGPEQDDEDPLYNPYKYYNYLIGTNSRLDAVQAAVLRVKLKYLDRWNDKRAENAEFYNEALMGSSVITPKTDQDVKHCWHQYVLRSRSNEKLAAFLTSRGVGNGSYYPVPIHLQKAFEYLGYKQGDLPVSEMLSAQTVCLPVFPELKSEEREYVAETILAFEKGK